MGLDQLILQNDYTGMVESCLQSVLSDRVTGAIFGPRFELITLQQLV